MEKRKMTATGMSIIFSITYMVSYITRINYGAIITEMESATQISKSLLSMALTGGFITYGAGQIISGLCGDRFSPKKLVALGLTATTAMNLLIPICKNPYQMTAVWCLNGFAQAFMWPPIVRLMTAQMTEEEYNVSVVRLSWGSSFGTISVYLISPLIIAAFGWKYVFVFSAACGLAMLIAWNKLVCDVERVKKEETTVKKRGIGVLFTPLMLSVMLGIAFQGMLRDGVQTWTPSYISETYNLSGGISILSSAVLPIFSIICNYLTLALYRRAISNPLICAGTMFGAGTVSAFGLYLLAGKSAAASVAFLAILTGCMHGVNVMLTCMIPPLFKKEGNSSTVAGALNACTYIGSATSTYGIAYLTERSDWSVTLITWVAIGIMGTATCLLCAKLWRRRAG